MAPPRPPDKVLQLQTRRGRYLRQVYIEENLTVLVDYVTYRRLAEIQTIDRGKVKSAALRLENLKKAHQGLARFGVKILPDFMSTDLPIEIPSDELPPESKAAPKAKTKLAVRAKARAKARVKARPKWR